MQAARLFKNWMSKEVHKSTERRLRQRDVKMVARCGEIELNLYGEEGDKKVENISTFQYLGRPLDKTDDN